MVIVLEKDQSVKNCRDWERDNFNLIYSYKVSYYNNVKNPCEIVTFLLKKNYMGLKKKSFKLLAKVNQTIIDKNNRHIHLVFII